MTYCTGCGIPLPRQPDDGAKRWCTKNARCRSAKAKAVRTEQALAEEGPPEQCSNCGAKMTYRWGMPKGRPRFCRRVLCSKARARWYRQQDAIVRAGL
jgi:hypothetical protein